MFLERFYIHTKHPCKFSPKKERKLSACHLLVLTSYNALTFFHAWLHFEFNLHTLGIGEGVKRIIDAHMYIIDTSDMCTFFKIIK